MAPNTKSIEQPSISKAKISGKGPDGFAIEESSLERGHSRRMGHSENYFAIMQRQKLYTNFNMYGELNKEVTREQLAVAIRQISSRHPIMMQAIIPKKFPEHEEYYTSDDYYNTPFPENDFLRVITSKIKSSDIIINEQSEDYGEIIDMILSEYKKNGYKFDAYMQELIGNIVIPIGNPNKPNWRSSCSPSAEGGGAQWKKFVYISNHCCSDAISAVNSFQDIAENVSLIEQNSWAVPYADDVIVDYEQDVADIAKSPAPITERVEYRPPLSKSPKIMSVSFSKTASNFKSDASETRCNDEYSGEPETSAVQMGDVCYDSISNYTCEEVAVIRDRIKHNVHGKCTVTPFIQAAFFVAMHQSRKSSGQKQGFKEWMSEWGVDMATPSSTRRYSPEDPEVRDMYKYGSNVGGIHYSYMISGMKVEREETEKFWSLVEYYHDILLASHSNGDQTVGSGTSMSDVIVDKKNVDKSIRDEYSYQKRGGVIMSNAGYFHQDPAQAYHVTDSVFGQRPGASKFSFGVNVVSTNIGGMNLNVGMVRRTSRDRAEFREFIGILDRVIRDFTGSN